MRIWVDNNQFILGIAGSDPASEALMKLLPYLDVVLPRIVLKEVTRNLNNIQITRIAFASERHRTTSLGVSRARGIAYLLQRHIDASAMPIEVCDGWVVTISWFQVPKLRTRNHPCQKASYS